MFRILIVGICLTAFATSIYTEEKLTPKKEITQPSEMVIRPYGTKEEPAGRLARIEADKLTIITQDFDSEFLKFIEATFALTKETKIVIEKIKMSDKKDAEGYDIIKVIKEEATFKELQHNVSATITLGKDGKATKVTQQIDERYPDRKEASSGWTSEIKENTITIQVSHGNELAGDVTGHSYKITKTTKFYFETVEHSNKRDENGFEKTKTVRKEITQKDLKSGVDSTIFRDNDSNATIIIQRVNNYPHRKIDPKN